MTASLCVCVFKDLTTPQIEDGNHYLEPLTDYSGKYWQGKQFNFEALVVCLWTSITCPLSLMNFLLLGLSWHRTWKDSSHFPDGAAESLLAWQDLTKSNFRYLEGCLSSCQGWMRCCKVSGRGKGAGRLTGKAGFFCWQFTRNTGWVWGWGMWRPYLRGRLWVAELAP